MANTYTYMQIQSSRAGERNRGEEQGAEERAGGRSSEQGRALTLGAWGGCREEQRREADGSLQGGGAAESAPDRGPAGRRED